MMEKILKAIHKSLEEIDNKALQRRFLHIRINSKDSKMMTALHYAAQNNHIEISQLLMNYSKPSGRRSKLIFLGCIICQRHFVDFVAKTLYL